MILKRFYQIPISAWVLLLLVSAITASSVYLHVSNIISATAFSYEIQPIEMIALIAITYVLTGNCYDYARQKREKIIIIINTLAILFAVYMMTGLLTTFVRNALVTSPRDIILNVISFGTQVVAMEYSRYKIVQLAGRKNIFYLGWFIVFIYALQETVILQILNTPVGKDLMQLFISTIVPSILTSFLLTYLAIVGGLGTMLTYQLGALAMVIFPPFIPKYNWYMTGVASLVMIMSVYIEVDNNKQKAESDYSYRSRRGKRLRYDIILAIITLGMVTFVAGIFEYKPVVVMSNSMVPVFSRGSVVVVQKINNAMDIKKGDIVQYEMAGHKVIHRVVSINLASDGSGKRIFTTKGDNNSSNDPLVQASQISGVVRMEIPDIGLPTVLLHSLVG